MELSENNIMELSETAKDSYLDFCGVSWRTMDDYWNTAPGVSYATTLHYNRDQNVVKVVHEIWDYENCYYDKDGLVEKKSYNYYLLEHTFTMLDKATLEYKIKKTTYHRQGSDNYRTYDPGDIFLSPTKEEETHLYQVPENFKLKNGLDPSIMKEIEEQAEQTRKR